MRKTLTARERKKNVTNVGHQVIMQENALTNLSKNQRVKKIKNYHM